MISAFHFELALTSEAGKSYFGMVVCEAIVAVDISRIINMAMGLLMYITPVIYSDNVDSKLPYRNKMEPINISRMLCTGHCHIR